MERSNKLIFLAAACWNWFLFVLFFFCYPHMFVLLKMKQPVYPVLIQLVGCFVFIFGIGCYWASRDLANNRSIVKLNAIARILCFVIVTFYVVFKQLNIAFLIVVIVDLIIAILFIRILSTVKK